MSSRWWWPGDTSDVIINKLSRNVDLYQISAYPITLLFPPIYSSSSYVYTYRQEYSLSFSAGDDLLRMLLLALTWSMYIFCLTPPF